MEGRLAAALALVLLLPAALAAPSGAAEARTDTRVYAAATLVPPEPSCHYDPDPAPLPIVGPTDLPVESQGVFQQACFDVRADERRFAIEVTDASGLGVVGWYVFQDAQGRRIGDTPGPFFCNHASGELPEGTRRLFVVLWGFQGGCGPAPVGVSTVGFLSVSRWP